MPLRARMSTPLAAHEECQGKPPSLSPHQPPSVPMRNPRGPCTPTGRVGVFPANDTIRPGRGNLTASMKRMHAPAAWGWAWPLVFPRRSRNPSNVRCACGMQRSTGFQVAGCLGSTAAGQMPCRSSWRSSRLFNGVLTTTRSSFTTNSAKMQGKGAPMTRHGDKPPHCGTALSQRPLQATRPLPRLPFRPLGSDPRSRWRACTVTPLSRSGHCKRRDRCTAQHRSMTASGS